jgi:hypothetical protein
MKENRYLEKRYLEKRYLEDLDRHPWRMEISELYEQTRIIKALLELRLRQTFAQLLISYACEIESVLYQREVNDREPGELSGDELEKCIELVHSLSLFRPRRKVAVPVFDFLHALLHEQKERDERPETGEGYEAGTT